MRLAYSVADFFVSEPSILHSANGLPHWCFIAYMQPRQFCIFIFSPAL